MKKKNLEESLLKALEEISESKPNFKNEKEWKEARINALKRNFGIEE